MERTMYVEYNAGKLVAVDIEPTEDKLKDTCIHVVDISDFESFSDAVKRAAARNKAIADHMDLCEPVARRQIVHPKGHRIVYHNDDGSYVYMEYYLPCVCPRIIMAVEPKDRLKREE